MCKTSKEDHTDAMLSHCESLVAPDRTVALSRLYAVVAPSEIPWRCNGGHVICEILVYID